MSIDNSEQRTRRYASMRSIKDYGMGVLIVLVAFIVLFPSRFGLEMNDFDDLLRYMFAGLCILYGSFRIYRGYKKAYFKE